MTVDNREVILVPPTDKFLHGSLPEFGELGCPAILLAWGGYQSGAEGQSAGALEAIAMAIALVPALAVLAAFLLMWTYPLTESLFSEMMNDIRKRAT